MYSSNEFVEQLKQINSDLLSSHYTSLNYLTDQQSAVSRIMSTHNSESIAETSTAILYLKSLEHQSYSRLNRKTELKRQCWLHNFYQINELCSNNLTQLSKCNIDNINSTTSLSNTYFHSLVNEMLYQSVLGTTNTLYAIGIYNPYSEQWKISKTLEGLVKHTVDGWNGTMSIVDGEVEQIKHGVENIFQKLERCDSHVVQKFLNSRMEITSFMNKCL